MSPSAARAAPDAVRVDQWLWAVRLFPTRSSAADACRAGHVRVNGTSAKPATKVGIGDRVSARVHARERLLEVARVIDKRVGAPLAAECLVDHGPSVPQRDQAVPARQPGTGRPTKRDRRKLDRLRA